MDLTVIIPVYNENEIIKKVIEDWNLELTKMGISYEIRVYNDGSKDNTLQVLNELLPKYQHLVVIDKQNSGHGPTILQGYKSAKSDWVFQVDSDDEMQPNSFPKLWEKRNNYDFLIGNRYNRLNPASRKIVTFISRMTINLFYGRGVVDVNSPYRLFRSEKFSELLSLIPSNTFAPNVIVSGFANYKKYRIFETDVPIKFRTTGEVSIKKWKLLKAAAKSLYQTVRFRFVLK